MDKPELEIQKLAAELEKVLLEKEKLQKDLDTYAERFEIEKKKIYSERNRFWAETARLLGVSLISGLITYLINQQIENRQKENTIEVEEFKKFMEKKSEIYDSKNTADKGNAACSLVEEYKTSDNKQIKLSLNDIRTICSAFSATIEQQAIIDKKEETVKRKVEPIVINLIAKTEKDKNEIEEKVKAAKGEEKVTLLKLETSLENKLDSLVAENPSLDSLSKTTEKVTQTFSEQIEKINEGVVQINQEKNPEQGYPKSSWFKEDYFLTFDDMKIVLEDLYGNSIKFSICISTSPKPCPENSQIKTETDVLNANRPVIF